jgi:S1-C subfamily serine protease
MSDDTASIGAPPGAACLEHLTGPARDTITWLAASTLDVALEDGRRIRLGETPPGEPGANVVARLHRAGGTYEIERLGDQPIWVNREPVKAQRLNSGDIVEFGDKGPMSRFCVHNEHEPARRSVGDIVADAIAYVHASRKPLANRIFAAVCSVVRRLSRETTRLFRLMVLVAIIVLTLIAYQQYRLNALLQAQLEADATRLESFAAALARANEESLKPNDLQALRQEFAREFTTAAERLADLERRSVASARVVAQSAPSVAFLQGAYGYREAATGRMLRQVLDENGQPLMSPRGMPLLSLDGEGAVAERQFTGTAFAGEADRLLTNRHVALPWESDANTTALAGEGLEPVMVKFIAYWPGDPEPEPIEVVHANEAADLAILSRTEPHRTVPALPLAASLPAPGDEVVLIGYPTGLRSMLAQAGAAFVEQLHASQDTGFWSVAARLAEAGHVAPLASRGIVGQSSAEAVIYDAETTHGGSGGPVLDTAGAVVAINAAVVPDYTGSNIGIPVTKVHAMLAAQDAAVSN